MATYYTFDGSKLTLTDGDVKPVRRGYGELVQRTLEDGDDPDVIAKVMTREFRQHVRGASDFSRPLRFPKRGVA